MHTRYDAERVQSHQTLCQRCWNRIRTVPSHSCCQLTTGPHDVRNKSRGVKTTTWARLAVVCYEEAGSQTCGVFSLQSRHVDDQFMESTTVVESITLPVVWHGTVGKAPLSKCGRADGRFCPCEMIRKPSERSRDKGQETLHFDQCVRVISLIAQCEHLVPRLALGHHSEVNARIPSSIPFPLYHLRQAIQASSASRSRSPYNETLLAK